MAYVILAQSLNKGPKITDTIPDDKNATIDGEWAQFGYWLRCISGTILTSVDTLFF